MGYLWKRLICGKPENYKPYRKFILLNILMWSLPEFAVAFIVCQFASLDAAHTIMYVGIITGYIGVIVGLFGGMIYLMRKDY